MSETKKLDAQLEELNIASTPEEAADATTIEQIEQNSIEEEAPQAETEEASEVEEASEIAKPATRREIITRLKEIAESEDALNRKSEVELLKVQFYRLRTMEIESAMKEFVAEGGEEALFIPQEDELEAPFKEYMNIIKEKRAAWIAAQEEELKSNYEKKEQLLQQIQTLVEKAGQGTPEVNEFKALQAQWKEIKNVPQDKVTALWKQYHFLV